VVVGWLIGSLVNSGIVMLNGTLIALPEGTDVSTMEGLRAAMPFFEPIHYLIPFLSHAIGTLVGAIIAARMASGNGMNQAIIVGFLFLQEASWPMSLCSTVRCGSPSPICC
jgi:hypothetical protein